MLQIMGIGRLTRDGVLSYVGEKKTACLKFSVACSNGAGDNEITSYLNCTVWGVRAEGLAKHLNKGLKVFVSGDGNLVSFKKKDGTDGTVLELSVDKLEFCEKKAGNSAVEISEDDEEEVVEEKPKAVTTAKPVKPVAKPAVTTAKPVKPVKPSSNNDGLMW